jgi:hypothetical protein
VPLRFDQLTEVPSEPIPLSVLTGFLGSGKTTLLSKVLSLPDLRDTAVVISEFGAIALGSSIRRRVRWRLAPTPTSC